MLAGLLRRGEEFAAAEDAVQEAVVEALRVWPAHPPRDPRTLDEQDRSLWDTAEIAEGVAILQGALAEERPGRYQIQAAIAALHADAMTSAETDWPQILAWYDDLVALSDDPERDDPAAVLNRAVAVGHVDGARAGLAETERVRAALGDRDQWHAVRAYLHELEAAAKEYAAAAERATELAERDHLVRRAARARARFEQPGSVEATLTTRRQTHELDQTRRRGR